VNDGGCPPNSSPVHYSTIVPKYYGCMLLFIALDLIRNLKQI
jgi:NADH:ubiquinone oxidoreductase subunit 3 (subunit A)